MYLVNSVALWWTITIIVAGIGSFCANSFKLSELVKRIYDESDSSMVCFIGVDDYINDYEDFIAFFMRKYSEIPVSILTTSLSDDGDDDKEGLFSNNAVVVIRTPRKDFRFFLILDSIVERLRVRKFVIIFTLALEDLKGWFVYFWEKRFTRIFGIADDICYAYLPFASNQVQQIGLQNKNDTIPDALKDLNGLIFRTSLQRDIPRAFPYPDKKGKRSVGGSYGQVFVNFLRKHNATYEEIIINNSTRLSIPGVINATISNEIDISMNVFTPTPGLDYSYPVKFVSWNILVPLNGYVDPNEYFIKPFSVLVWIMIGVSFAYIILMEVLKDSYLNLSPNLWNSFSQTMLAMLNLSPEKPITTHYSFHVQVLLLSFVLGKLYNIYVTSFLTAFIRIKQFETIQDLIDNNVIVMIPYYEWALISDMDLHPEGFERIVASVDYATYITEMNSMRNTSYAYGVGSDRGEFLISLQTYFAKPIFHSTQDGLVHLGFLLAPHSPFTGILSAFVIEVFDTGLIMKWDSDCIVQAIAAGFEIGKSGEKPPKLPIPLTFHHLAFAWNCLMIGWIFAVMVFAAEHWKWLKSVFSRSGVKFV
ncbi:uncharacterized protein LOC129944651 [Eupeodes corollae]|uniref:uncharacterized protein LOC129944651 n=1 Tax=Eupeodes corollae TaxID=290404 RepID=UPI0024917DE9|nr:uncharacterized protein LOC129944651 [Eupeodes corollae]